MADFEEMRNAMLRAMNFVPPEELDPYDIINSSDYAYLSSQEEGHNDQLTKLA